MPGFSGFTKRALLLNTGRPNVKQHVTVSSEARCSISITKPAATMPTMDTVSDVRRPQISPISVHPEAD